MQFRRYFMAKKTASVNQKICVACGACTKICPKEAIYIYSGCYAKVDQALCVGCGLCAKTCPAGVIELIERGNAKRKRNTGMIICGFGQLFILL